MMVNRGGRSACRARMHQQPMLSPPRRVVGGQHSSGGLGQRDGRCHRPAAAAATAAAAIVATVGLHGRCRVRKEERGMHGVRAAWGNVPMAARR